MRGVWQVGFRGYVRSVEPLSLCSLITLRTHILTLTVLAELQRWEDQIFHQMVRKAAALVCRSLSFSCVSFCPPDLIVLTSCWSFLHRCYF